MQDPGNVCQGSPVDPEERRWRAALWCLEGVGATRYEGLLGHFGTAAAAFAAGPEACAGVLGRPSLVAQFGVTWGAELRDQLETALAGTGTVALARDDQAYPDCLAEAGGPPWLFVRGHLSALDRPYAAVVGTRRIRTEGARLARQIVGWCGARGWAIASGGARGVDGEAHRAALELGLVTSVVLPAGVEHLTPPSHQRLFESVCEQGGCLVSDHPPWRSPRRELFARRNRLISGLSVFTIVVRAPLRSGALITAHWAVRQGRSVFAVPGSPDDPTAAGCLELLREGASLLAAAGDLPRACPEPPRERSADLGGGVEPGPSALETPIAARLLEVLRRGATTTEGLAAEVGLPVAAVLATLTRLALAGHVETTGPGVYIARA